MMESLVATDALFSGDTPRAVPCGAVVLTPTMRVDSHADALAFYQRLRAANRALGCDFFEGVVMSRVERERCPRGEIGDFGNRADSICPMQLRSATRECRGGASAGGLGENPAQNATQMPPVTALDLYWCGRPHHRNS